MTAAEMAVDRGRNVAEFYRRAAAKGKAGGAKGKGKYVKGSGQKGVCGPGGGAACHKGYRPGVKSLRAKAARSGMLGRMQEKSRAAVGASAVAKAGQDVAKARRAIVEAKSAGAAKAGARKAAADKTIGGLEARRAAVRAKGDEARAKLAALDKGKGKGGGKAAPDAKAALKATTDRYNAVHADPKSTAAQKAKVKAEFRAASSKVAEQVIRAKAGGKSAPAKPAPDAKAALKATTDRYNAVHADPKSTPAQKAAVKAEFRAASGKVAEEVVRAKAGGGGGTAAAPAAMKAAAAGSKFSPKEMAAGRKRMDDAFRAAPGAAQNRVKASEIARGMKGMAPADKAAVILEGIKDGKYKIVGKDKAGTDAILARLQARASGKSAGFAQDAEFARAGFYAKKAGAANKAAGRKHVKGSTPKGVCGPGGGKACHKNYRAERGTSTRKALAAEARAARAAGRGGSTATTGATAAARAKAAAAAPRPRAERDTYERNARASELKGARKRAQAKVAEKPAAPKPDSKAARAEAVGRAVGRSKEAAARGKARATELAAKSGDRLDAMSMKKIDEVQKGFLGKSVGTTKAEKIAAIRAKVKETQAKVAASTAKSAPAKSAPAKSAPAKAEPAKAAGDGKGKGYSPKADTKGDDVPNPAGKRFDSDAQEAAAGKAYRERFDHPLKVVDMPPAKLAAESARMDDAFRAAPGAKNNFVTITEVRERMSHLSRAEQDTVIMKAVEDKRYGLDSHEGLAGKVTDADRRAAIVTGTGPGQKRERLIYISRRQANFARAGFYAKKAGAANKAAGRKHVKGSTPKGVCGPGGGRACHKNYQAKRGTDSRKALAAEARAARAASRGGAAGATAAVRGKAIGRMVAGSKAAAGAAGAKAAAPRQGPADRRRALVAKGEAARKAQQFKDRAWKKEQDRLKEETAGYERILRERAMSRTSKEGRALAIGSMVRKARGAVWAKAEAKAPKAPPEKRGSRSDRSEAARVLRMRRKDYQSTKKLDDDLASYVRDPFKGRVRSSPEHFGVYQARQRLQESRKRAKKEYGAPKVKGKARSRRKAS